MQFFNVLIIPSQENAADQMTNNYAKTNLQLTEPSFLPIVSLKIQVHKYFTICLACSYLRSNNELHVYSNKEINYVVVKLHVTYIKYF